MAATYCTYGPARAFSGNRAPFPRRWGVAGCRLRDEEVQGGARGRVPSPGPPHFCAHVSMNDVISRHAEDWSSDAGILARRGSVFVCGAVASGAVWRDGFVHAGGTARFRL